MRKSILVTVLAVGLTIPIEAQQGNKQESRAASDGGGAGLRMARYQVAAGTALLVKLRTPLDSATAAVDDQVDAELWSPVIQDGIELIPVGSVAIGKVLSVVRASNRAPLGTITLAFTVIEHAGTGDRAMLATRNVVVEAPRQARGERGRDRKKLKVLNVTMAAGTPLVAMTAEPLLVRIPR